MSARILCSGVVFSLLVAGCGGGGESLELVRYEITRGELDFNMDSDDAPIPIPSATLIVRNDCEATYEFAKEGSFTLTVDSERCAELRERLDSIDFEAADETLSGEVAEGLPALSVTHDGVTVDLGDKFFGGAYGEGPKVSDQMNTLLSHLDKVPNGVPEIERAIDDWSREQARAPRTPINDEPRIPPDAKLCPDLKVDGSFIAFRIFVRGLSCDEATSVVSAVVEGPPPADWACDEGPVSFVECTRGTALIGFNK